MKYMVLPSAVKYGSASTPSPANGGGFGSLHPLGPHWLTKIRHPEKLGVLRTKYSSPVLGSKAGWDSNCGLEMPAGFHCVTFPFPAESADGATSASATRTKRLGFMAT